jgi:hypothetical protein
MNKHCLHWTYNTVRVQEEGSIVCGLHWIFYLIHRCAGHSRSGNVLSIECQSLAYSLCTVVNQDLSVSIDFDHVVKFCIQDDVNEQIPAKRYNPTLKTEVIFAVIWDSIPVRERCIKTKEIPSPERNTLKETSYLDSSEATNHQSFRQLSQKHAVLDVIHVATGNRGNFDFYKSDGVFTAGLFQSFDVTHSYGRT